MSGKVEIELSFCFGPNESEKNIKYLFENKILHEFLTPVKQETIEDFYLGRETRIRKIESSYCLVSKEGDKKDARIETSCMVEPLSLDLLKDHIKLVIEKERTTYSFPEYLGPDFEFIIDVVKKPMKIIMIEIECDEPKFKEYLQTCITAGLKRNSKNAWDYFHRRVGFAGAPGSGKTSMSRGLTNKLSIDYGAQIEQVMEYARTHISRYGIPPWSIQPLIEWGQNRREQDVEHSPMTVTDSPCFLPYFYTLYNFKEAIDPNAIFLLSKMYKGALYASTRYTDLILLTPKEVGKDGIRVQTVEDSVNLYNMMETFLSHHNIPFIKSDYNLDLDWLIRELFTINTIGG